MEYKTPERAVIMLDVSEDRDVMFEKTRNAHTVIQHFWPDLVLESPSILHRDKMERIASVIAMFDRCDTLFCNTCGDEVDHLYRYVRAIAKTNGLQIIPVNKLREEMEKETEA